MVGKTCICIPALPNISSVMLDKLLKLSKPELSAGRIKTSQVDNAPFCENAFQAAKCSYEYVISEDSLWLVSDQPPEHCGSREAVVEEGFWGFFVCLFVCLGLDFFLAFHMSLFYERHCVTDKGELKQWLNSKATNYRQWTNLLGCVSMFSTATPHPSPYPGCCMGRGHQGSHFYGSSYCSKAHALSTFPHSLLSPCTCSPRWGSRLLSGRMQSDLCP